MADGMTIKGAAETVLYLKNFQRDIFDTLAKEVRAILERTRKAAKGKYPGGAWTISFGAAGKWPGGMIRTASGSSAGGTWGDAPAGAKAAIFDKLGYRTPPAAMASPQARATAEKFQAQYGSPQRFLWPAWKSVEDESMREVERAFEKAESQLQSKIDRL